MPPRPWHLSSTCLDIHMTDVLSGHGPQPFPLTAMADLEDVYHTLIEHEAARIFSHRLFNPVLHYQKQRHDLCR